MTWTGRRVQAMRGHLVRLVALLAVLAGLGLAVGLQCTDGMAAMPMNTAGASMECTVPAAMGEPDGFHCTAAHAPESSGAGGLGGMLTTCLAFIIAVVVAVMALPPARPHSLVRLVRSLRVAVIRAAEPRAPSLAELCSLRT